MSRDPLCQGGCGSFAAPGRRYCGGLSCLRGRRVVTVPPAADPPAQLGLLDTPHPRAPGLGDTTLPRARRGDPETSHEATKAAARGLNDKQRRVLHAFQEWGAMHDELLVTLWNEHRVAQLARGFGDVLPNLTDSSLRSRRAELVALRLLRDSGRTALTSRLGKTTIWDLTDQGRATPTARPR